ncbi:iron-containing alcohol dehydrogenase [Gordonia sp. FQ]|uniref:iron-containing alcohol dehydrogenase n=1 Tax=Gordonia sp. FQ TaxID=3446634 RepID=UPI003F8649A6
MKFTHRSLEQTVHFATGAAAESARRAVADLGGQRVFVIASARAAAQAAAVIDAVPAAAHFDEVAMHVPVELAERARLAAAAAGADLLLSIGGGSATGLAKAIALESGLPIVAIPTTYSGSEATPMWGLTDADGKRTGVDDRVLPRSVVYDAAYTASMPVPAAVTSGLNALAHCIDSLWAPNADPINAAFAAEGIRALGVGLRGLAAVPGTVSGAEQILYATYLSGVAFASAGSGLHHKIAHVLGGAYNLPHAPLHSALLPFVTAFNAPAAPAAAARLAAGLGADDGLTGLVALYDAVGAPRSLTEIGFDAARIGEAVAAILPIAPPSNPRPVTAENLTALLTAATRGDDPAVLTEGAQS